MTTHDAKAPMLAAETPATCDDDGVDFIEMHKPNNYEPDFVEMTPEDEAVISSVKGVAE